MNTWQRHPAGSWKTAHDSEDSFQSQGKIDGILFMFKEINPEITTAKVSKTREKTAASRGGDDLHWNLRFRALKLCTLLGKILNPPRTQHSNL